MTYYYNEFFFTIFLLAIMIKVCHYSLHRVQTIQTQNFEEFWRLLFKDQKWQ